MNHKKLHLNTFLSLLFATFSFNAMNEQNKCLASYSVHRYEPPFYAHTPQTSAKTACRFSTVDSHLCHGSVLVRRLRLRGVALRWLAGRCRGNNGSRSRPKSGDVVRIRNRLIGAGEEVPAHSAEKNSIPVEEPRQEVERPRNNAPCNRLSLNVYVVKLVISQKKDELDVTGMIEYSYFLIP